MESKLKKEPLSENRIRELSALNLAYIGDTVFDLYIRSYLIKSRTGKVQAMHKSASGIVNAKAQAQAAALVEPLLSEREKEIFRLGKNAKSAPPKNMTPKDYSLATAIEAVIGYLYLTGQQERTDDIFDIILKHFL